LLIRLICLIIGVTHKMVNIIGLLGGVLTWL
jgi:hypothetical protein